MSKEIEEIKAQLGKCLCEICLVKDGQIKYLLSHIFTLEEKVKKLEASIKTIFDLEHSRNFIGDESSLQVRVREDGSPSIHMIKLEVEG